MPSRARLRCDSAETSRPRNSIRPALIGRVRVSRLNSVDLPAPFGPIRPTISPARISKLTSSTATRPPKRLTAPCTASTGAPAAGRVRRGSGSAPAKRAASTSGAAKRPRVQRRTKPIRPPRAYCSSRMKSTAKATACELAGALRQERQRVLEHVLQQQHHRRAGERAAQLAEAAAHRHQQVLDARAHVERRRADEAVHVRVEPAGQAGEQRGEHEQREPHPERVGADARQQHRAAAQAPDRAARPRLQQVAVEEEGQADQRPDQVVDRVRLDQRPAADASAAARSTSPVWRPNASTLPNRSAIERPQAIVLSGRKWPPRRSVSRPIASAARPVRPSANNEAEPGRGAVRRRQPGGGVGGDADERGLAERGGAADAGEQHQAERDQRADADVVEQRDAELAEPERRERDRGDEHRDQRRDAGPAPSFVDLLFLLLGVRPRRRSAAAAPGSAG